MPCPHLSVCCDGVDGTVLHAMMKGSKWYRRRDMSSLETCLEWHTFSLTSLASNAVSVKAAFSVADTASPINFGIFQSKPTPQSA